MYQIEFHNFCFNRVQKNKYHSFLVLQCKLFGKMLTKQAQTGSTAQLFSIYHTVNTSQNSFYKWTKISSLEIKIFGFKKIGEKWSRICFEIHRAPSEIPASLPGQFSPTGQIFLHWAAATLKGLGQFQNKFQTTFHHHF